MFAYLIQSIYRYFSQLAWKPCMSWIQSPANGFNIMVWLYSDSLINMWDSMFINGLSVKEKWQPQQTQVSTLKASTHELNTYIEKTHWLLLRYTPTCRKANKSICVVICLSVYLARSLAWCLLCADAISLSCQSITSLV